MSRLASKSIVIVTVLIAAFAGYKVWESMRYPTGQAGRAVGYLDKPARAVSTHEGFVGAVKKLAPAVVSIKVAGVKRDGWFASQFTGEGSGVVISPDGFVVTNAHVVRNAERIVVRLIEGKEYSGYVVGKDERYDIAVVKVDAKDLPIAELGDSDKLQVGEWVLAIGNPLGFENTLTVGVVSAKNRGLTGSSFTDLIQTDAAINEGNSGGALANIEGQVIGINTLIISPAGGSIGLGFAVPINEVRDIAKLLIKHQRAPSPYIGVVLYDGARLSDQGVRGELARVTGLQGVPDHGVVVRYVRPLSPAAEAGLKQLDVIMSVGDRKLESSEDLYEALKGAKPGQALTVKVWSRGALSSLRVTVGDRPDDGGR